MRKSGDGGLVYSTDGGRMCPACVRTLTACVCKALLASALVPQGDGVVRVSRETRGRGGKTVTLVRGLALDAAALLTLGRRLRTACGAGGTVRDGVVEVQGDHCARVVEWLKARGWRVVRAGS